MEFIVLSLLLLDIISTVHSGLLDAFGNIVDHNFEPPIRAFNPLYQMNNAKNALEAGFNGNTDSNYSREHYWQVPNGDQRTVVNGFPDPEPISDEVKEKFPEGVKLLNQLKELNKLKSEGKLDANVVERFKEDIGNDDRRRQNNDHSSKEDMKSKADNSNVNKPFINDGGEKLNENTTNNTNMKQFEVHVNATDKIRNGRNYTHNSENVKDYGNEDEFKAITITKYDFQAQPVVPEYERKNRNMTLYYTAN